ncbi:hypothetical protein WDZ92_15265 [Nostoc sp. NIES-2111]
MPNWLKRALDSQAEIVRTTLGEYVFRIVEDYLHTYRNTEPAAIGDLLPLHGKPLRPSDSTDLSSDDDMLVVLTFKATDSMHDHLLYRSQERGMGISPYVRSLLNDRVPRYRNLEDAVPLRSLLASNYGTP